MEPWQFMWLLSAVIFAACKAVSWFGRSRSPDEVMSRAGFYGFMWPGLNAQQFLDPAKAHRPALREILGAIATTAAGAALVWGVSERIPLQSGMLRAWAGMIGIIWMLHFGTFHLISGFWRFFGIQARPLMDAPLRSRSLAEFWGQRWNTAFRDLSNRALFRPLARKKGVATATWIVFLISGVVHDAVISLPAGGGYGLPTLYFLIQAVGMFAERRLGIGGTWKGRLFAILIAAAPAPLLFHRPFARNVILPFLDFLNGR